MRKEDFFGVLGEFDDDIVEGAKKTVKKKRNWKTLAAMAAGLCLVVMSAAVFLGQSILFPGDISTPGSEDTGGGREGGMYSVAVYPAGECEENVDSAEVVSLTEKEALDNRLAEHLPKELPEGFHYGRGSIYDTVMKDGTQYHMLRIEYITGEIPEQKFTEDGGAISTDPELIGDTFIVCVMNYEPKTDTKIYSSREEITVSILEENGMAYIRSGNCCIGIFPGTAEPAKVLEALRSTE